MQLLANVAIDGLAYGMVLFIIAVGLSVTLGRSEERRVGKECRL